MPPAISADGTVYFGSWDHHLYAIDGIERDENGQDRDQDWDQDWDQDRDRGNECGNDICEPGEEIDCHDDCNPDINVGNGSEIFYFIGIIAILVVIGLFLLIKFKKII
ncbi:PQQ-binding-like beta-propeller repeat protein [Candidatus Aenigmatarchaeota archaeon]